MNISKKREYESGRVDWRLPYGALHREDGPAVIDYDGTEHWYKNGYRHREDGPAVICPDGAEYWYKNGEYHRTDGPAMYGPGMSDIFYIEHVEYDPVTFLIKSYEYTNQT